MNESLFEFETIINEEVGLTSIDRYRGLANFAGQGQSNVPNKQMLQHSPIGTLNGKQLLYGEELANGAPLQFRVAQNIARNRSDLIFSQSEQPNAFPLNIVDRVDNRNVNARYLAATTGYRQPNPTNLVREPTNEVITEPFRIGRNEHNYRSSDFAPFHNIEPQFRNDIDRRGDILKS